jgi:hypothetical protein
MAMRGLLADINVIGPVRLLVSDHLESVIWREVWMSLNLAIVTFADLELSADTPDADVWHRCQQEELGLLTGNRNKDGPDSLEATIQACNTPTSLPVFTIANVKRMSKSSE